VRARTVAGILALFVAFTLVTSGRSLWWTVRDLLRGGASVPEVRWYTSLETARRVAVAEKRPLYVEFSAVWCGPCQDMQHGTYRDPEVVRRLRERFVPVRSDIDNQAAIAARYGVTAVPDAVVLDPDGTPLLRATGYHDAAVFVQMVDAALARSHPERVSRPGGFYPLESLPQLPLNFP